MEAGSASEASVAQLATSTVFANHSDLGINQFFDALALLQNVAINRVVQKNRSYFIVDILDGSLDKATSTVKAMPLTMYFGIRIGEEVRALMLDCKKSYEPATFFCIKEAKGADGKFWLRSARNMVIKKATGPKAENLMSKAELHILQVDDAVRPGVGRKS